MDYYNEIKNKLIDNESYQKVKDYSKSRYDLITRYNVGKLLSEAGKHYGEGIIKKYSDKLSEEINKKYNITTLKRMRQFYYMIEKGAPLGHQLTWSHYRELLPLKNIDEIKYYIKISEILRLTRDELKVKIKNKEYERIDDVAKNKLINDEQANINDFIKNPILLKNKHNYDVVSEKMLQKIILEDIPSFLDELGIGFTFIKNEYKIKIDDEYNYIDLLLFNYEYNCFVVVELKTTKLQKDHIGQIQVYMNYINKNLKKPFQTDTIGIIICKKSNKFIIEYCSDIRVLGREYKIIS